MYLRRKKKYNIKMRRKWGTTEKKNNNREDSVLIARSVCAAHIVHCTAHSNKVGEFIADETVWATEPHLKFKMLNSTP